MSLGVVRFPPLRQNWKAPSQSAPLSRRERRKLLINPEKLSEELSSDFSQLNLGTSGSFEDAKPQLDTPQDEKSSSQNSSGGEKLGRDVGTPV